MIVVWIVYGLLIGSLLAGAARCLDEIRRMSARPIRWVWVGALVLTAVLTGVAPYRQALRSRPASVDPTSTSSGAVRTGAASRIPNQTPRSHDLFEQQPLVRTIMAPMQQAIATGKRTPTPLNRYLAALWLVLSALVLGLFAGVHLYFNNLRRSWPVTYLYGVQVRVAPDIGPLVVGLYRPEIVIPQWLLSCRPDEQRLVLAHECEHIRARDPLLLAAAWAAAALLPWHPATWWMFSRVRLAVELDCDGRVLRQGIARQTYSNLLVDLAGRHAALPVGMTALADKSSHLEKRLLAMNVRPRFTRTRRGILIAAALVSVALIVPFLLALPTHTPTQTTLAKLIGTWGGHQDDVSIGLTIRPDSTFILARKATESSSTDYTTGRAVRLADDTLMVVVRSGRTRTFEIVANDQKLALRATGDDEAYFLTRQPYVGAPTLANLIGTWDEHQDDASARLTIRSDGTFTITEAEDGEVEPTTGYFRLAGDVLTMITAAEPGSEDLLAQTFIVTLNGQKLALHAVDSGEERFFGRQS